MHPANHVRSAPDRAALIFPSGGVTTTYAQLEERSNRGAHLFRSLGLRTGDAVAILMENNPWFLEVAWAAQRAGLYFTCIATHLKIAEVEYILKDSGARALITSPATEIAERLATTMDGLKLFMVDRPIPPFESFEDARSIFPSTPIADQSPGADMLYTSGTTGNPKGVKLPLSGGAFDDEIRMEKVCRGLFEFREGCTYLCPAPLYHSAPLRFSMTVQRIGGTVILMDKFDPASVLELIERFGVDCAQFVPTHFIRMLRLPPEKRTQFDLSSLRSVIHAAAPCPIPVKEAMIDWWGPLIHEFYSGTEPVGMCHITSKEWLRHKGSVGRAVVGTLHICDEDGASLPPRSEGLVYFEGGTPVAYHNDEKKTSEIHNDRGWVTLGDVGWMDEDGYLYLTDRKSFMIVSGGVNIYPQEIENLLIGHPLVSDVAVIGAPHDEMGEQVVAVVQPMPGVVPDTKLANELIAFAREQLSPVKAPKRVDFVKELPREANGKLYKRQIRDSYWTSGERPVA